MIKHLRLIGLTAAIVALSTLFLSCNSNDIKAAEEDRMVVLSHENGGDIVYDRETGIEYWVSMGHYNWGDLSVLFNEDGKPLIFERN